MVLHLGFFGWARVQNRRSDRRGRSKARADCRAIIGTMTPRATACSFGAIPAGSQSAVPGRPIRDAPLPGPAQNSDGLLRGGSEGPFTCPRSRDCRCRPDDTLQLSPDIGAGGLVPVGQRGVPKHRRAAQMTGNLADAGCMLSGQIVAINKNCHRHHRFTRSCRQWVRLAPKYNANRAHVRHRERMLICKERSLPA